MQQQQIINCHFKFMKSYPYTSNNEQVYACVISNVIILESDEFKFIGAHKYGKSNFDVIAISFDYCKITKIPQGLLKSFPNLKIFGVYKSKLRQIEKEDLADLDKIKLLKFSSCEIAFLPDDLFADMKCLEYLSFYNNKTKIMEPNILDGLNKLKFVRLILNSNNDMVFDSINNRGNATLEEVKRAIRQKYLNEASSKLKPELENGISSDLKCIIQNEKLKDFTVRVQGEEFKVHKFLLSARSATILEMIEQNIDAEELSLNNISIQTFRDILNFMYTDELSISNNTNFANLFMAADILKIKKLKNFCAEKLIEKINVENAFEMITLANKYEHERLREKSFEQIKKTIGNDSIDAELAVHTNALKEFLEFKNKPEREKMDNFLIYWSGSDDDDFDW